MMLIHRWYTGWVYGANDLPAAMETEERHCFIIRDTDEQGRTMTDLKKRDQIRI